MRSRIVSLPASCWRFRSGRRCPPAHHSLALAQFVQFGLPGHPTLLLFGLAASPFYHAARQLRSGLDTASPCAICDNRSGYDCDIGANTRAAIAIGPRELPALAPPSLRLPVPRRPVRREPGSLCVRIAWLVAPLVVIAGLVLGSLAACTPAAPKLTTEAVPGGVALTSEHVLAPGGPEFETPLPAFYPDLNDPRPGRAGWQEAVAAAGQHRRRSAG